MAPRPLQRNALARALLSATILIACSVPILVTSHANATDPNGVTRPGASGASTDPSKPSAVAECVEAHSSGQELLQIGQLLASRSQLLRCSQEVCPELVRSECSSMLDELRMQVPSVVFRIAVDGVPRSDVEVVMDGQSLFSEVPARAFELDPGKHRFVFRHGQFGAVKREVTITDGEKLVPISVQFTTPVRAEAPPAPIKSTPAVSEHRPVPLPVYLLSGVGALGLGGFIGFGLATRSKESDLRSSCSPSCAESDVDTLQRRAMIADVSLGVGALALAAAATYYFLRPTETVRVGTALSPNGDIHSQLRVDF